ncbi:DedA family protein [Solirubrobacter ginsenosidimutans]|uniref:DedA family protein n=1 Tax=Solirubrobacter ginsenosidimutans TaxID=490573 RepID=A0A9X3S4R3_9ACTN|nr:DedA family protein [Solirubrobacter ginsenosidimutans]MDA0163351.1 DedA family protein [Solirubrobacter ginsenosidimutans]
MFAALIDIPANVGYTLVFVLIAIETMGIPVPAETALIGAALLAHRGQMDIGTLTILAATAAILGDNVGFAIGRHFGRRVFVHPGPLLKHRLRVLELGEPFFERHGPKAVFLGRWVAGLRIASAWLAGMNKMPWPTFLFWNALGGITWAASIALSIYFLGDLAEHAIEVVGPISAGIVVAALVAFWVYRRRRKAVEARTTNSGTDGE